MEHEQDYMLWCGDLNYRVDVDRNKAKQLVADGDFMVSAIIGE